MLEIIDIDSNVKVMALIICGIKYGDNDYVMYSVKRDDTDDNIFISRIVKNSDGYVMDNNFFGGEKEVMDGIVATIFNKYSMDILSSKGIGIISNVKLSGINKFSISSCYVTTIKREFVKDMMVSYGLLELHDPVVVSEKDTSWFSKGNISSSFFVVMGIIILMFCIGIIAEVYLR